MSLAFITPDQAVLIISIVAAPILSLIVVIATYMQFSKTESYGLNQSMGNAKWDFSQSWASTLTVVGAILGTIIGGGQLSTLATSTTHPPSPVPIQFTVLNLVFLVLVSLAPLIYNIHGSLQRDAQAGTYYRGSVGGFLAACWLTLWGAVGELMTLIVVVGGLFGDPQTTGSSSQPQTLFNSSLFIAQFALLLALSLVLVYGWTAIPRILQEQVSGSVHLVKQRAKPFTEPTAEVPDTVKRQAEFLVKAAVAFEGRSPRLLKEQVSGSSQNVGQQAKLFMESTEELPDNVKQQARSLADAAVASAARPEGAPHWSLL